MQNMDFYEGRNINNFQPQFEMKDMEYFSRMSDKHVKNAEKGRKRATRMIFLIIALCIISFTTGIIIGIKFSKGSQHVILDDQTYKAVSGISQKVSNLMSDKNLDSSRNSFPKESYPYVIKIGNKYRHSEAQDIANFLSNKGHRVILSKKDNSYKIYTGPFKSDKIAGESFDKIINYTNSALSKNLKILKR